MPRGEPDLYLDDLAEALEGEDPTDQPEPLEGILDDEEERATSLFASGSRGNVWVLLNAVTAAGNWLLEISKKLSSESRARGFSLYADVLTQIGEGVRLPEVRVVSVSKFSGSVSFSSVPDSDLGRYASDTLPRSISKALDIDLSKIVGGEKDFRDDRVPNSFRAFLFTIDVVDQLRKMFPGLSLLDALGIRTEISGDRVRFESDRDHLPGFSLDASMEVRVEDYDQHEHLGPLHLPKGALLPSTKALASAFFVSILDQVFGYDPGSYRISPEKSLLAKVVDQEDLDEYQRARSALDVNRLVGVLRENGDIDSRFLSGKASPEELSSFYESVGSAFAPIQSFLLKRFGVLGLPISPSSLREYILASIFLSLSLYRMGALHEYAGKGSGGGKLRLSDFLVVLFNASKDIARYLRDNIYILLNDIKEKIYQYVYRTTGSRSAARIASERIYSLTKRVYDQQRSAGYRFTISFAPETSTAFASKIPSSKFGKAGYRLNFNPVFLVVRSINSSVRFDALFLTILIHEFLHVYLRHLEGNLGKDRFVSPFFGKPGAERYYRLLPSGVDNIQEDALINSVSLSVVSDYLNMIYSSSYNSSKAYENYSRLVSMFYSGFYLNLGATQESSVLLYLDHSTPHQVRAGIATGGENKRVGYSRDYRYSLYIPDATVVSDNLEEAVRKFARSEFVFGPQEIYSLEVVLRTVAILVGEASLPKGGEKAKGGR